MSDVRALALAAVGVTFVRSPRYLAEKIADAVDSRMLDVRDERRFWTSVIRAWELRPSELPELQARVASKYCRNLDLWQALPRLRQDYRLLLVYSGPTTVLDCWRQEYGLEQAFDAIVAASPAGYIARDPALYRLVAERSGFPVGECAVADSTAEGTAAAIEAGAAAYRFGTIYGLDQWLVGRRSGVELVDGRRLCVP